MVTLDTQIKEIGLETKALLALLRFFAYHGKENPTIGDVSSLTKKQIIDISGVGKKKAFEIIEKLHSLGFMFKDEKVEQIKEIPQDLTHLKEIEIEAMRNELINEENNWDNRIKTLELALEQAKKKREDIYRKLLYVESYLPSNKWKTK